MKRRNGTAKRRNGNRQNGKTAKRSAKIKTDGKTQTGKTASRNGQNGHIKRTKRIISKRIQNGPRKTEPKRNPAKTEANRTENGRLQNGHQNGHLQNGVKTETAKRSQNGIKPKRIQNGFETESTKYRKNIEKSILPLKILRISLLIPRGQLN